MAPNFCGRKILFKSVYLKDKLNFWDKIDLNCLELVAINFMKIQRAMSQDIGKPQMVAMMGLFFQHAGIEL